MTGVLFYAILATHLRRRTMTAKIKFREKKHRGKKFRDDAITAVADTIGWTREEVKACFECHKKPVELVQLFVDVARLFGQDRDAAVAWFLKPTRLLDNTTPKERVLRGEFTIVRNLVDEMHGGLSY